MTFGSGTIYRSSVPFRLAHFALDDRGERTPSGGLKVRARLSRTGVQTYHRPDGSEVRELRPEEEVFAADALASFRGAPVTDLHPAGAVTPESWQDVARGHVGDDVRRDGDYVAATLYIQDAELVRQVQDGKRRELSAGYQVELEEASGEVDGERFDRIQRQIRGNHVATLPPGHGRAGPEVALRLDAADDAIATATEGQGQEETRIMKIRIDGIDHEIPDGAGTTALSQAIDRREAAITAELEAERSRAEEAKGRADVAEARSAELEAKVAELEDPAHLHEAAQRRATLVLDARTILGDDARDFGAATDREIMAAALGDRVDAASSEDYLRGAFAVALENAKKTESNDHLDELHRDAFEATKVDGKDPMDQLEAKVAERNREAWTAPMAMTRS